MHEWSLAQAVVKAALDYASEKNIKEITGVTVSLGELQSIDRECFDFALKEIAEQMGFNPEFKVEVVPAEFECRSCGRLWKYDEDKKRLGEDEQEMIHFLPEAARVYVSCPGCGSRDFRVKEGRGVLLTAVEGG